MRKLYKGIFNYQGEVHTLFCHAASFQQAHKFFMRQMSALYQRNIQHMVAYYDGSKDNYEITEEPPKL